MLPRKDRLPIVNRVVVSEILDIDEVRMLTRAKSQKPIGLLTLHVNGQRDAFERPFLVDITVDEAVFLMQTVMHRRAQCFGTAAQAKLAQPRTFADDDAEGSRRNLRIETPVIALFHLIENFGEVRDKARQYVDPARGTFRIGEPPHARRQSQILEQRHNIYAANLKDGPVRDVDCMHSELTNSVFNARLTARQKTRTQTVRRSA